METKNSDAQALRKRVNRKFKAEEDALLKKLVRKYGTLSWDLIAAEMHGRNARQCHDRWRFYLSPKINNKSWTPEEDKLLIQACQELNGKWVKISKKFKGRTEIQIKNRWNILKRAINPTKTKKTKTTNQKNKLESSSPELEDQNISEENKTTKETGDSRLQDNFMSLFKTQDENEYDSMFDFFK